MVDTGTELSVVTKPVAPLSKKTTAITGVSGEEKIKAFKCQMAGRQVIHEFLYIPESPVPLLGSDLLSKLGAQVTFSPEERPTFQMDTMTHLLSLSIPPQDEWRLHEPPKEEPGGPEGCVHVSPSSLRFKDFFHPITPVRPLRISWTVSSALLPFSWLLLL